MGAMSKRKGASFERWVCAFLSECMTAGQRDDLFWRSSISGGRSTVRFKKGRDARAQAGDVTAIDPLGAPLTDAFMIECKHVRNLNLDGLLKCNGALLKFWIVARLVASKVDKQPLLIAKQNGMTSPLACMEPNAWTLLPWFKFAGRLRHPIPLAHYPRHGLTVFDLRDLRR